jgi:oxygen-independent coproporphyrinogen-3 oxidase
LRYKNELVSALLKEIDLHRENSRQETVETIYFGGGTPSICLAEEIQSILEKIKTSFTVIPGAEITLEANPDDISGTKLPDWKAAGINRLSIGIQSFFEEDLRWMNRAHNAQQAIDSLETALRHFDNITTDLIYGTPGLTHEKWKQNVARAVSLGIPHLSCYALTVEPKTPLDKMIRQHRSKDVDPDLQAEQFLLLMDWLGSAGYEHYEISNFARPGHRSRHNSSYWQGKKYIGLGPSAHSFDGVSRWWNIANNHTYIESVNKGIIPYEREILTPVQQLNEYIMISLRTMEGVDLSIAGKDANLELRARSKKYLDQGLLTLENDCLKLTREGKLLADGIAADLFMGQ